MTITVKFEVATDETSKVKLLAECWAHMQSETKQEVFDPNDESDEPVGYLEFGGVVSVEVGE